MIFFRRARRELDERRWELSQREAELARQRAEIDERLARLDLLLANRVEGYEHIASAWADWERLTADGIARYLAQKKHPAPAAAEVVRERGRAMAELRRRMKLAEYVTALYEFHFPWLVEFRDVEAEIDYVDAAAEPDDRQDPASRFLSKEEWSSLSSGERNQLALVRYLRSRMMPWQLGRDYERYVGYLREQAGRTVTYHGIVKGFEDLGRDILAEKDDVIEVIQCKRWAQHKEIHEKHIFQLFGTMVACRVENPGKQVTGTFTTTTTLSDRARQFADVLDIHVEEALPLADYPRIKCNINRRTSDRIYHLPFDQQYDTTLIEPDRGERYVATATEAEERGFRRAWRWRGESDQ